MVVVVGSNMTCKIDGSSSCSSSSSSSSDSSSSSTSSSSTVVVIVVLMLRILPLQGRLFWSILLFSYTP